MLFIVVMWRGERKHNLIFTWTIVEEKSHRLYLDILIRYLIVFDLIKPAAEEKI